MPDPVRHRRELVFDKAARVMRIVDSLECRERHIVERFWHFAEDVAVTMDEDGAVMAQKAGYRLRLAARGPAPVTALHRGRVSPPSGWVSRRFGVKVPATTVVWHCEITGATRLEAVIEFMSGGKTT